MREVWAKDLGSAVQGAPVLNEENVILSTIENGIFALRLGNGTEIWHRTVEQGQIIGRIALIGQSVYYGAGRTVHACNAQTGKLLWQTPLKRHYHSRVDRRERQTVRTRWRTQTLLPRCKERRHSLGVFA